MKPEVRVFEITSPTKEIIISNSFFKLNSFCTAHGARKHVRAVSKHSLPLIDFKRRVFEIIEFKPHVFEIHLVNQQVVSRWGSNSFA